MKINVKNKGAKKIFWEISNETLKSEDFYIFKIEPSHGYLKGFEEIVIEVKFSPVIADKYELKVPVYLNKNYQETSIDLVLKGKSSNPKI